MSSLRIDAPSAAAAFVLVDLLGERCKATSTGRPDGSWEISVPLNGGARATVSNALSAATEWLAQCGLESAAVTIDGRTRVLRRNEVPTATT